MRTFLTLLGREIKSSFYSPIAYVVICFFLIATGVNLNAGLSFLNHQSAETTVVEASFNGILFWFPVVLIFPLLTMRTYSDEFRMGTFETLTTAPVQDWQVVLAKFVGVVFFYCVLWLPSIVYFLAFKPLTGQEAAMAPGAFFGSYLMVLLLGMFYISIGCLASALTTEQITAAVMSFVVIFALFFLPLLLSVLKYDDAVARDFASYFSSWEHMGDFNRGLIDSRRLVYYLSMTGLILFINFHVFQYRKWKA